MRALVYIYTYSICLLYVVVINECDTPEFWKNMYVLTYIHICKYTGRCSRELFTSMEYVHWRTAAELFLSCGEEPTYLPWSGLKTCTQSLSHSAHAALAPPPEVQDFLKYVHSNSNCLIIGFVKRKTWGSMPFQEHDLFQATQARSYMTQDGDL